MLALGWSARSAQFLRAFVSESHAATLMDFRPAANAFFFSTDEVPRVCIQGSQDQEQRILGPDANVRSHGSGTRQGS